MRIALFAPYVPAPAQTGGRIRIHRLAQSLRSLGPIELFAYAGAGELAESRGADELGLYASVTLERAAFAGPAFRTPRRARYMPRSLCAAFQRRHSASPFDLAVVEHCYAGRVESSFGRLPWVLDEHNVESDYLRARLIAAHGRVPWLLEREHRTLEAWERRLWRAATRVVCVSEADAVVVARESGRTPDLVPNGVAAGALRYVPPSARTGHEILFVGLMSHAPNVRAAERLALEVLPAVQAEEPRARLVLCGANPVRAVKRLERPDVVVTGRVPSVAPYLERAAAYANALEQGGGTSLKLLEAFASGLPVVSTGVGARGFGAEPGRHYLNVGNPNELARELVRCLRDRTRWDEMSARARALAETFDWSLLGPRFAAIAEAAVREQRGSGAAKAPPG